MASPYTTHPQARFNAPIRPPSPDLLLVVFIHGFKGTNATFRSFPGRLAQMLSGSINNMATECISFPEYKTKGQLVAVVHGFSEWLRNLVRAKEAAYGCIGKAKVVLCGHSMGGLIAADALRLFVQSRQHPNAPLWPRIIACLGFDTPFLGLHPHLIDQGVVGMSAVADAISGYNRQSKPMSTGDKIMAVATVAIAAYDSRKDIKGGYKWAMANLEYIDNLFNGAALNARLNTTIGYERQMGVLFRTFYTMLPANQFVNFNRTFIALPMQGTPHAAHFLTAPNSLASHEINAHTGMFDPINNNGYARLESETLALIKKAVMSERGY